MIENLLRDWKYRPYLRSIRLAGSHAKGTDLADSDYDYFLNLSAATPGPIAAIPSFGKPTLLRFRTAASLESRGCDYSG